MIAEQCIFCHGCSKGNCPAGITTQSDLTARRLMTEKKGRLADDQLPDGEHERYLDANSGVVRYLRALAGELRGMACRMLSGSQAAGGAGGPRRSCWSEFRRETRASTRWICRSC